MPYTVPDWLQRAVAEFGRECKQQLQDGIGEPEAAIRSPLEKLLTAVADQSQHKIVAHGETPLSDLGVRPDYAIRVDSAVTGYLEVKKPGLNLDPSTFRGHNKRQWEQLRDLPDLIYTNGTEWRLYRLTNSLRWRGCQVTCRPLVSASLSPTMHSSASRPTS